MTAMMVYVLVFFAKPGQPPKLVHGYNSYTACLSEFLAKQDMRYRCIPVDVN